MELSLLDWWLRKQIRQTFTRISRTETTNIERQMQINALHSTTAFVEENFSDATSFGDRFDLIAYALSQVFLSGLYLEFGVHTGKSINFSAKRVKSDIHGFDSFDGLPEFWRDGYDKGVFSLGSKLPKVQSNVILHPGWFDKTLPEFIKTLAPDDVIAFLHIDCDLYSSTKTIFDELGIYIQPKTIILFDDYFNHPHWQQGEHKAFLELVERYQLSYEYIGFNKFGDQVAVRIL
jgi:Macrocin-O-methyltransferase (TylF)